MLLLLPWCLGLMWRLAANGAAGTTVAGTPAVLPALTTAAHAAARHLRVFLALRCVSFALGGCAQQGAQLIARVFPQGWEKKLIVVAVIMLLSVCVYGTGEHIFLLVIILSFIAACTCRLRRTP
eukprot:scaffold14664_cov19-Tisochrysis_lutea.AAC.1